MNKIISSFFRLKKPLNFHSFLFFYKAYIQTVVQYAVLYGTACITALETLNSKLNLLGRIIFENAGEVVL